MSVYTEQARKFMQDCNATMKFMYLGKEANADWNDNKERDTYMVNIVTPKETCRLNSGIVSVTQLKTHILIGYEFIPQYMTFLHVCKNTMSEALMTL